METIGDVDILVVSNEPNKVMEYFTGISEVERILSKGKTKSSIITGENLQIDLRVIEDSSFGSALQYFTGSKEHNIQLRKIAQKKNWKLSEYALRDNKDKLPKLDSKKSLEGIGVVEAPRGTLIHHYFVNKHNLLEKVKLFIATEINIPIINEMITKYAQKLYIKHDINAVKEELQVMIRAFDPCISCATH
jgi:Ni,Fe-hydrogenase I large subunit